MLPPESASAEAVALEVGVSASTLQRWHSEALAQSPGKKVWTAAAQFDAMLVTAAMDEAGKAAWCRANGVYLKDLQAWRDSATHALAAPEEMRASPNQTKQDRRRIPRLLFHSLRSSCSGTLPVRAMNSEVRGQAHP